MISTLRSFKRCCQSSTSLAMSVVVLGDLEKNINIDASSEQSCTVTEIKRERLDMKLDAKNVFIKQIGP